MTTFFIQGLQGEWGTEYLYIDIFYFCICIFYSICRKSDKWKGTLVPEMFVDEWGLKQHFRKLSLTNKKTSAKRAMRQRMSTKVKRVKKYWDNSIQINLGTLLHGDNDISGFHDYYNTWWFPNYRCNYNLRNMTLCESNK